MAILSQFGSQPTIILVHSWYHAMVHCHSNPVPGPDGLPRLIADWDDKSAYALCMFGYCEGGDGDEVKVFEGRSDGTIVSPRGSRDFGWDPVFQPDGFNLTYAEMDKAVKNTISHRGRALQKVKAFFDTS